jgi:hypothetical protein
LHREFSDRAGFVIFDRYLGRNQQSTFASELVDAGLNRCNALVAVIDESWLHPRNIGRLFNDEDWVAFELTYALEFGLQIAIVGTQEMLAVFDDLELPSKLVPLKSVLHIQLEECGDLGESFLRWARVLSMTSNWQVRVDSCLHASVHNNEGTRLSLDEAHLKMVEYSPGIIAKTLDLARLLSRLMYFAGALFLFLALPAVAVGSWAFASCLAIWLAASVVAWMLDYMNARIHQSILRFDRVMIMSK